MLRPAPGKAYPERAGLRAEPARCRRPLTLEEVWRGVAAQNAQLEEAGHAALLREEVAGGRLYSGPMCTP